MATRLSTSLRETIVDNVIKATDLPELKDALKHRLKTAARDLILAQLPQDFVRLTAGLPKEWLGRQAQVSIWAVNELGALKNFGASGSSIELYDPVSVPENFCLDSKEVKQALLSFAEEAERLQDRERELRHEVMAFLLSCSTVEKAVERMPELAPHIPKQAKPMPLVAPSNLLSSLAQLGFDRTTRNTEAA